MAEPKSPENSRPDEHRVNGLAVLKRDQHLVHERQGEVGRHQGGPRRPHHQEKAEQQLALVRLGETAQAQQHPGGGRGEQLVVELIGLVLLYIFQAGGRALQGLHRRFDQVAAPQLCTPKVCGHCASRRWLGRHCRSSSARPPASCALELQSSEGPAGCQVWDAAASKASRRLRGDQASRPGAQSADVAAQVERRRSEYGLT